VVGESQSEPGCRSRIRLEAQVEADQSPVSGQRKHAADAKEGPTDVTSLATLQAHADCKFIMSAAGSAPAPRADAPARRTLHSRGPARRAGTAQAMLYIAVACCVRRGSAGKGDGRWKRVGCVEMIGMSGGSGRKMGGR
jgi:hypothetical protein